MLGQAAADGLGVDLDEVRDSGRDGITGAREKGAIGFHAVRGGDIVGEHEILFANTKKQIKINHITTNHKLFSRNALQTTL